MRIIREKIDEVYRFKCVNCESIIETEYEHELDPVNNSFYEYECPVCNGFHRINKAYVKKINIYEDKK